MTRVLHTARISNVKIIKCVVKQYAGPVSHINLVNGPAHHESLVAQSVRAPNWYLGGHGFNSHQGLRLFLCPTLVSLLNNSFSLITELKICHLFYLLHKKEKYLKNTNPTLLKNL